MKYEFRYYKNALEALNKSNAEQNKDYITFLSYDTETNEILTYWFTTEKVAGTSSDETIYKNTYGYKDTNFEHILEYKNCMYNELNEKGFAAIEDFMKWSSKANCFQWVKVD